jgi:membrane associated rhomboid family serine protease
MNGPLGISPLFTYGVILVTIIISAAGFYLQRFYERNLFWVQGISQHREFYRVITAMFLHADWTHLIFNMFSFYSFSRGLETVYGAGMASLIYFGGGILGNLLSLVLHRNEPEYRAIGASGAVSAIIFASIFLLPGGKIIIFPIPLPLPSWVFAFLFVGISIYGIGKNRDNIGHDAHLGGAMAGTAIALFFSPEIIFRDTWLILGISILIALFFLIRKKFAK